MPAATLHASIEIFFPLVVIGFCLGVWRKNTKLFIVNKFKLYLRLSLTERFQHASFIASNFLGTKYLLYRKCKIWNIMYSWRIKYFSQNGWSCTVALYTWTIQPFTPFWFDDHKFFWIFHTNTRKKHHFHIIYFREKAQINTFQIVSVCTVRNDVALYFSANCGTMWLLRVNIPEWFKNLNGAMKCQTIERFSARMTYLVAIQQTYCA